MNSTAANKCVADASMAHSSQAYCRCKQACHRSMIATNLS